MEDDFNIEDMKEKTPEDPKKHAQIDFFVHESDMMQKDVDNERMHETHRTTIRNICITFIGIIIIFVVTYTVRTNIFMSTINKMNDAIMQMAELHHNCGAEVGNAVHQQPDQ